MTFTNNLRSSARSIYYPSKADKWTGVDWSKVEKTIANLQHRITKAVESGDYRKVKSPTIIKKQYFITIEICSYCGTRELMEKIPWN